MQGAPLSYTAYNSGDTGEYAWALVYIYMNAFSVVIN